MRTLTSLQRGDRVPHVSITRLDGTRVNYVDEVWQQRQLLLVSVSNPEAADTKAYLRELEAVAADCASLETVCIVTADELPGLPRPGVLIADRWGEVHHVEGAASTDALPRPAALVDWLRFLAHACPECEGEAK